MGHEPGSDERAGVLPSRSRGSQYGHRGPGDHRRETDAGGLCRRRNGLLLRPGCLDRSGHLEDAARPLAGSFHLGFASSLPWERLHRPALLGECPDTQGYLFRLSATDGTVERVFDVVPNGCNGGGVWSSPTIDMQTGHLYIATGNSASCGEDEPYAMVVVELRPDSLAVVGSWQVPDADAAADGDFGSTPTLFTASIGGISRALVGAVNKNGISYAFRRGAIGAGSVWRADLDAAGRLRDMPQWGYRSRCLGWEGALCR